MAFKSLLRFFRNVANTARNPRIAVKRPRRARCVVCMHPCGRICGSREVLFVTAFEETGRSAFARYKRSSDNYRASFRALAAALYSYGHPLVAYDDTTLTGLPANTVVLPVANVSTFTARYAQREQEIMAAARYRRDVAKGGRHRTVLPEHTSSRYGLANHDKVIFVADAARRFPAHTHVCWIDYGFRDASNIPRDIDLSRLPRARVLYQTPVPVSTRWNAPSQRHSPRHMLASYKVFVVGTIWVVPSGLAAAYAHLYEEELREWQKIGVSDDDQALVYQLQFRHPWLFDWFEDATFGTLFRRHLNSQRQRAMPVLPAWPSVVIENERKARHFKRPDNVGSSRTRG